MLIRRVDTSNKAITYSRKVNKYSKKANLIYDKCIRKYILCCMSPNTDLTQNLLY